MVKIIMIDTLAGCMFSLKLYNIKLCEIENKYMLLLEKLRLYSTCFSTKHVLPCWILQIEYSASKSGMLCFSGWIPDSMLLVSTWILTKNSSFKPCKNAKK